MLSVGIEDSQKYCCDFANTPPLGSLEILWNTLHLNYTNTRCVYVPFKMGILRSSFTIPQIL